MVVGTTYRLMGAGFGAIVVMLLIVLGLWIRDTHENVKRIEHLVDEHEENSYLTVMRDRAQRRAISLHRMALLEDPFERDEEFLRFQYLASDFLGARDDLLGDIAQHPDVFKDEHEQEELALWRRARDAVNNGGRVANAVVEQIGDNEMVAAKSILTSDLPPALDEVQSSLAAMSDMNRNRIERQLELAVASQENTYNLMSLFGVVVVLSSLFMAWALQRARRTQTAFREHGDRVRRLYEISSAPGMTFREKIVTILRTGCEFLGMELGLVSRFEIDTKNATLLFSVNRSSRLTVVDGESLPLDDCPVSSLQNSCEFGMISFTNRPEGLGDGSLSAVRSGILVPVAVNGEPFGSVVFCSTERRSTDFTVDDKDLANLIATWIGMTLEKLLREKELEEARMRAEVASRTKSGFLANMSHELRTPLNAIIGYSELLMENPAGHLVDEEVEDLRRIGSSGRHLLSLINDILDISRIEAGKLELDLQDQDVTPLIDDVKMLVQPLMERSGNRFSVEWPHKSLYLCFDDTRLRQILLNILGNAAKFCSNGSVNMRVYSEDSLGFPRLMFEISDTGIGIDADKISRLFKPFSQVENKHAGQYGGTGLGLAISRRLAIMMEGNIEVQSRRGEGTTFRVWLPIHSKQQMEHGELMQIASES